MKATEHLELLAERHGVEINWITGAWKEAEAFYATRQVWVPKPWSRALYLVALHEFGHIVSDLARSLWDTDDPDSDLACEAAAWGWAVHHAAPELMCNVTWDDLRYLGGGVQEAALSVARGVRG